MSILFTVDGQVAILVLTTLDKREAGSFEIDQSNVLVKFLRCLKYSLKFKTTRM